MAGKLRSCLNHVSSCPRRTLTPQCSEPRPGYRLMLIPCKNDSGYAFLDGNGVTDFELRFVRPPCDGSPSFTEPIVAH
jgi:hypothetical protein